MRARLLALVVLVALLLPAGAANAQGEHVQALFEQVTRATPWTLVAQVPLGFDAHHPEGLARVGDRWVLSTVEVIEPTQRYPEPRGGTDRTAGRGIGHLIAFDAQGRLLEDRRLDDGADIYHPGGLDFDGRHLWVAVAEYRPSRPSIIYRVDPATLVAHEMFRSPDHIGGIVHDPNGGRIVGLNWGSRVGYEWTRRGRVVRQTRNPNHFVDYQDCKYVGRGNPEYEPRMFCSGIATVRGPGGRTLDLGGLGLVDLDRLRPAWEVPFQEYSPAGRVGTHNAMWIEALDGGRLRLSLLPDDDDADLLVYEAAVAG